MYDAKESVTGRTDHNHSLLLYTSGVDPLSFPSIASHKYKAARCFTVEAFDEFFIVFLLLGVRNMPYRVVSSLSSIVSCLCCDIVNRCYQGIRSRT